MKTCLICEQVYDDTHVTCPTCWASTEMPWNAKEWIKQAESEYAKILGPEYLTIGLQKDAIQNGWGARLSKRGIDWSFEFEFVEDKKRGSFLLLRDEMCYGLTGPDIREIKDDAKLKDKNCRLARFRSMFYSGDNLQGAGSFGRGKMLNLASSKRHLVIYDTLTHTGEYKLGFTKVEGNKLMNSTSMFIGNQAKKYLKEHVSEKIKPLSKSGTRIIIVDPKEEIIDAIKSGQLAYHIADTWWPILKRELRIAVMYKGKEIVPKPPREFRDLRSVDTEERKCRTYMSRFDYKGIRCRFKNVQLFLSKKKIPEEIRGIYLYRREMKIAKIDIAEIPPQMSERFYGYIDLETLSPLENIYMEQSVEGLEHSSFDGYRGIFKSIKREIQECFSKFKEEMGYGHDRGVEERIDKEAGEQAYAELQKDWPDLVPLADGPPPDKQKLIKISLHSLEYPRPERFVNLGEDLNNIVFKVKNLSSADLNLKIIINTLDDSDNVIENLLDADINVEAHKAKKTAAFGFNVGSSKYNLESFRLVCTCKTDDGKIEESKTILVYIGKIATPSSVNPVSIESLSLNFPKRRRADFGDKVTQIVYGVKNETCIKISARFRLRVLESPPKQKEIVLHEQNIELSPNGEEDITCRDFEIEAEKYKGLLEGGARGPVVLRASVTNLEAFFVNTGNNEVKTYEKGDKLGRCDTKFWINCEAGKAIFDRTEYSWKGGEDESKSQVDGNTFMLNSTHPEYIGIKQTRDQNRIKNYHYEQLCRQILLMILIKGRTETWPVHPKYSDYKRSIVKEKVSKVELAKAIFNTLDHRLSLHYR